jgi:glycosyltransferase involved in cell wall biosynthesis
MKPTKVLHIIDVTVNNPYLNNLCDETNGAEIEYSFVTFAPPGGFVENIEKRGKKVYALNAGKKWRYALVLGKLWKIIKEIDPDVVNTHLFYPTLIGLTFAKWQGRKTVLTRHHSDAVYVLTSVLKKKFYLALENYINRRADHIIAPSGMVRDILVEKEGVPGGKVTVIPYGQTAERYDAITPRAVERVREELGMGKTSALVCVSRLYFRKGHRYLFEAFAGLTRDGIDATLYLLGEGDARKELETLAAGLGIADRVRFLGYRDDNLEIIAAADLIVHPSLEDALSQALIEALMLGRPIVATDISGAADTLDGGKYGKLVPPADAQALRRVIEETLGDLDSARKTAAGGRRYLLEYMDSGRVAAEYSRIYEELADKGRK